MSISGSIEDLTYIVQNHRDNVYFGLVSICFVFSCLIVKRSKSPNFKKWFSTSLGLFLVIFIMKEHVWHFVLAVFIGAFLIVCVSESRCHIVVFCYMLIYLTIFRFSIVNENKNDYVHINLMLMIVTCKLSGVAFEINNSYKSNDKNLKNSYNEDKIDPGFFDILHYTFSYFGMLVGPYVRYRTYDDFIKLPFSYYSNFEYVKSKILYVPVYLIFFIIFESTWPIEYVLSDEFRTRNFYYKLLYGTLQYQKFRFWMYTGLLMAECICAGAGLGAYPVNSENIATYGPKKNYNALKQISEDKARLLDYDFKTISNIDIYCVQTSPWISVYNRSWNKSIQYFMAMYVHKSLSKIVPVQTLRPFFTIIICAYWHGIEVGYQAGMIFLPLCSITDRIYIRLCECVTEKVSNLIKFFMYVYQYHIIGYGVMACLLLEPSKIYVYYSSLSFLPYIFMLFMHLIGLILLSLLKKSETKKKLAK